jgi:hypothetical protein
LVVIEIKSVRMAALRWKTVARRFGSKRLKLRRLKLPGLKIPVVWRVGLSLWGCAGMSLGNCLIQLAGILTVPRLLLGHPLRVESRCVM